MANETKKSAAKVARAKRHLPQKRRCAGWKCSSHHRRQSRLRRKGRRCRKDGPGQGACRGRRRLKAAAKATEAGMKLDTAKGDATAKTRYRGRKQRMPPRGPRPGRPTRPKRRTTQSSRLSRYRSTSAARHRSSTCGATHITVTAERGLRIRALRFQSSSATLTGRSALMCSQRWLATTRAFAGPRSRSTTGMMPRTRSTKSACEGSSQYIAPTALPRSSIIVSDEPLSRETNYRTEFIAVLSNQPQGGFITRRPTISFPHRKQQILE